MKPELLCQRLKLESEAYLKKASPLFTQVAKRPLKTVEVRCDLRGKTAGMMIQQGRSHWLRYNLQLAMQQPDSFIAETVPHEVAHLVVHLCFGKVRPHGQEWQAVMQFFGIADPQRCHNFDVSQSQSRRQRRWTYVCACREHELTTTRHKRVLFEQQRYLCKGCGEALVYKGD